MPTDPVAPSDKGETVAVPDSAAIQKLIDDAVGKALAARLPRVKNTEETIAKMVADAIAKIPPQSQEKPVPDGDEAEKKLTLKALQEQIATLTKGIENEKKRSAEAEQRDIANKTRFEVQTQFAKHLGADSPHIRPYVNEYMTQFEYKDGAVYRKTKDDYGTEVLTPADQAVKFLMESDLKHLVPAKNGKLPPIGTGGLHGSPLTQARPPETRGLNMLDADLIEAVAKDRPELAHALLAQAQAQQGNNGTSK